MNIKSVIGTGYGDEGKGVTTSYLCERAKGNVLNIKVNGGAQAGHTVCGLYNNEYKHWVFKQYGSGTFSEADTYLLNTFMVNIDELLKEREALKEIYNIDTKLFIDRRCLVTLPIDIVLNRFIENKRTNKHGSCGLGIFETFHRNKVYKTFTIQDMINEFVHSSTIYFENTLKQIDNDYSVIRYEEMKKEGITVTHEDKLQIYKDCQEITKHFISSIADLAKIDDICFCNGLDELIDKYKYTDIICECSQGLELDQFEERNWPHLTPSSTGLKNIAEHVINSKCFENCSVDVYFVTRSYKTKHGAGIFVEEDNKIESQYGLYDRTNMPNKYQGTLKYGVLNIGRIKKLILKQEQLFKEIAGKDISKSMVITHLDQTNDGLITNRGRIDISEILKEDFGINNKILKCYGEKATDIIE